MTERIIVLALDDQGCVHLGESGRLIPSGEREIPSLLPNVRFPAQLGEVPPVLIVSDSKAVLPWIGLRPLNDFDSNSSRTSCSAGSATRRCTIR